ncbi:MAG: hypothetical protein ACI9MR_000285 [Myxococcota bacterium]|jgi:hypothetical protein
MAKRKKRQKKPTQRTSAPPLAEPSPGPSTAPEAPSAIVDETQPESPPPGWTGPACLLLIVALVAVTAHPAALSPFDGINRDILGVPSELAFMMLGLLAWRHQVVRPAPLIVALIWTTWVVAAPMDWFGMTQLPVAEAARRLGDGSLAGTLQGLAWFLALIAVIAGWLQVASRFSQRLTRIAPFIRHGMVLGGAAMVGFHAIATVCSGVPLFQGLTAGLLLGTAALDHWIAWRWPAVPLLLERPGKFRRLRRAIGRSPLPFAVLAAFLLLKLHGMGPSNTDENIYFYMAQDLANGRWPYIDYFFAHPPMHVLLPGAVFAVFGYSFVLAKLFSVAAAVVAGCATYAIGRRHLGAPVGLVAMILFLFAAESLKASTNMTGVNLTTMWMMLGVWLSLKARPVGAGVCLALAVTTGFYSIAGALAILTLSLFRVDDAAHGWRRVRFGLLQLGVFIAIAGGINLIFWVAAGDAYVDGVYTYHGLKALRDPHMVPLLGGDLNLVSALLNNIGAMVNGSEFTKAVFYHPHLWMGLLLTPLLLIARFFLAKTSPAPLRALVDPRRLFRDGSDGYAAIIWLFGAALFVQYAMFRELYSFYWVLIHPALALLSAWVVVSAVRLAVTGLRDHAVRGMQYARLAAALLVLGGFASYPIWGAAQQHVFDSEVTRSGARNAYEWTESWALPGLAAAIQDTVWDDHRLKGRGETGVRHYLWNKKRVFSRLDEIADYIRANSTEAETIAGASTMAPLVALASGRRIAAGEVDTNNKRFKAEDRDGRLLLSQQAYWEAICADNVRFIVSTPRSYFTGATMKRLKTAKRWFRTDRSLEFPDSALRYGGAFRIVLYERVGPPPDAEHVCRWEDR